MQTVVEQIWNEESQKFKYVKQRKTFTNKIRGKTKLFVFFFMSRVQNLIL